MDGHIFSVSYLPKCKIFQFLFLFPFSFFLFSFRKITLKVSYTIITDEYLHGTSAAVLKKQHAESVD